MAQMTNYAISYIAGMVIPAGTTKTSAQILALYPTAKIIQMLSDNVRISINATDAVTFNRGDFAYIGASQSWTFTNTCEVAIGIVVNVVP